MTTADKIQELSKKVVENNSALISQALTLNPSQRSYYLDRISKIAERTEAIIKPLRKQGL